MRRSVVSIAFLLSISFGCGPFEVRTGPESCRVAHRYPSAFGPAGRGNVFRYRDDTAGIGLIAREGQQTSLKSIWTVGTVMGGEIPRGTPLRVAVGDETLSLEVGRDSHPAIMQRNIPGTGSIYSAPTQRHLTTWDVLAAVDDRALETLSHAPTSALRLELPGGNQEMAIPDHVGRRMQSLAICLAGGYPVR
ncbi:MAG: hypothetical protein H6719_21335 [Sandaracinaceae bacterium]|nr:hypothetical protein [Sandaracinaceae bacterium]